MHATGPTRSVLRMYWLLPAAFLVHDTEELVTVPSWVVAHRSQLAAFARSARLGEDAVDRLPTSLPAFAGAVAILLVLFLGVTWGATHTRGRGPWQFVFALLLGGFFLHGFTHLGQTLLFGEYTPGSVTAVIVVIPASLYLYVRLFRAHLLTGKTAVVAALLGIAFFIPATVLALEVGSWLDPY
jgi:Protein of unknown function with HXXEE motif